MSNPSGRLPVTFYYNGQDLPDFADYRMWGRTYKYVKDMPWRPFGFGLSYSRYEEAAFEKPIHTLVGFQRVTVPSRQKLTLSICIPWQELESVLEDGSRSLLDGSYTLFVGGSQPDEKSAALLGRMPLAAKLRVSQGKVR